MRLDRIIILVLLGTVIGCKTTQTTKSVQAPISAYKEDLSHLRPQVKKIDTTIVTENSVIPTGHIKMELDSITNMMIRVNAQPRVEQGFTIQVYNGSSREEATKALGKMRVSFPELESNITYFQPDFRVKSGQFLDRVQAYEKFQQVKKEFREALLIPEKIKVAYD
ncbi:MAG: hypothetical protein RIF46_08775 [Cyclobacteriaceae bacterium]